MSNPTRSLASPFLSKPGDSSFPTRRLRDSFGAGMFFLGEVKDKLTHLAGQDLPNTDLLDRAVQGIWQRELCQYHSQFTDRDPAQNGPFAYTQDLQRLLNRLSELLDDYGEESKRVFYDLCDTLDKGACDNIVDAIEPVELMIGRFSGFNGEAILSAERNMAHRCASTPLSEILCVIDSAEGCFCGILGLLESAECWCNEIERLDRIKAHAARTNGLYYEVAGEEGD